MIHSIGYFILFYRRDHKYCGFIAMILCGWWRLQIECKIAQRYVALLENGCTGRQTSVVRHYTSCFPSRKIFVAVLRV